MAVTNKQIPSPNYESGDILEIPANSILDVYDPIATKLHAQVKLEFDGVYVVFKVVQSDMSNSSGNPKLITRYCILPYKEGESDITFKTYLAFEHHERSINNLYPKKIGNIGRAMLKPITERTVHLLDVTTTQATVADVEVKIDF